MRRETNNDRQQRLFVTGLLISAAVGALIGLLWPLWFPADSACETTIPDASFSVPTLAMGGTQLPGEEGAAMKICCLTFDDGPSKYTRRCWLRWKNVMPKPPFLSLHRTRTRIICRI